MGSLSPVVENLTTALLVGRSFIYAQNTLQNFLKFLPVTPLL